MTECCADVTSWTAMVPFAETEQLIIRGIQDGDVERIAAFMDDPRLQRTGPDAVVPKRAQLEQQTRAFLSQLVMSCILEAKNPLSSEDDDRWVGTIHLFSVPGREQHRDTFFGIALEPRWWGQGFGTEATRWIVNYAFEQLAMHRVTLVVVTENARAVDLYKFIGFKQEAHLRKYYWQDGKWNDVLMMGILADEWRTEKTRDETFAEPTVDCNSLSPAFGASLSMGE